MAVKGLSKLIVGKYNTDGNTVTYEHQTINEKLAEYSAEVESSESNDLFLDNAIAESDGGTFQSGTLSLTTGDLESDTSKLFFNIKEKEITLPNNKTVKEYTFDDEMNSTELGVGVIEMHQVNSITFYRAIFFARVKFNVPSSSATTKGESIEWQTQEIEGQIMRSDHVDDNGVHPWKHYADFPTEGEAMEYLKIKAGYIAETQQNSKNILTEGE